MVRGFHDSNADGQGDLQGLIQKLDYLEWLGVDCIWLPPFYDSPLRDGGYDIRDFYKVLPEFGTVEDFIALLDAAHKRGIRIITDLVMNHTSDSHPWFQESRRDPGGPYGDYYVWSDTDERFPFARVIFVDTEESNWTYDPVRKQFFWHRFFSHQPDLNYENPQVQEEMMNVIRFWLDLGIDGFRLDAVPYLFEAEGTNCENLPQTHDFLRRLRKVVDDEFPGRVLLAEANQWPDEVVAYFGDGEVGGDECHMAFHFPLMPRLFMAVRRESRFPISQILASTPKIPSGCQWGIFLRNHDELTLEMVTDEERDYMYSLPGTPVIYYGDEIGMGDNIWLGDRDGVRTPMQWTPDRNAGFSSATPGRLYLPVNQDPVYGFQALNVEAQTDNPGSLLHWTRTMLAVRRRHDAFALGDFEDLGGSNPSVLAYIREYRCDFVLAVNNLSRFPQPIELNLQKWAGFTPVELIGGVPFPTIGQLPYLLTLPGHAFYWFGLRRPEERS
jgi:maltose alpha-D-glucosyltransferase/alpha-amylase